MTSQMKNTFNKTYVNDIINKLQMIDVDGETMQYILKKVGMEEQMLRQLVMSLPMSEVKEIFEERNQFLKP